MNKRAILLWLAAPAIALVMVLIAVIGLEFCTRYGTSAFQIFRNQFSLLACLPLLLGMPFFSARMFRRQPLRPWRALLLTLLAGEITGLVAFGAFLLLRLPDFKGMAFHDYLRMFPWSVLPWLICGSLLYALLQTKRGWVGRLFSTGAGLIALAGYWFYLHWPEVNSETQEQVMLAYRVTRHAWFGTLLLAFGAVMYGAIRRIRLPTHRMAFWPGWVMMACAFLFFLCEPAYPAHISMHDLEEKPFLEIQWAGLDDSGRLIVLGSVSGSDARFENWATLLLRFEARHKRFTLIRRDLAYPASPMDIPGEFLDDTKRVMWMEAAPLLRQLNHDQSRCEIVMLKSQRTLSFRWFSFSELRHSVEPKCRPAAFGPKSAWAAWDAEAHTLRGVTTGGKSFSHPLSVSALPHLLSTAQYLLVLAATSGDAVQSGSVHPATTIFRVAWDNGALTRSELPGNPVRQKEADSSGSAAFALGTRRYERETWYMAEGPEPIRLDSGSDPAEIMLPVWNGSNKPDWMARERLSFLLQGAASHGDDSQYDTFDIRAINGHWLAEQDRFGNPIALLEFGVGQRSVRIIAALSGAVDWQSDSVVFLAHQENRQLVIRYYPAKNQREILLDLPAAPGQRPVASPAPALFKFEIIAASPPQPTTVTSFVLPDKASAIGREGCKYISRSDREHLSYNLPELHPIGAGRCGMGMGPVRWKSPAATEACVWHLLNGCRPGDDDVLCAQAKLSGASGFLLSDLQANRLPCDISKRGAAVIDRIRDPEHRVNFCMSIALMGGPVDCLTRLRPEIVTMIRPSVFPGPSGYRSLNLSGTLTRFASLKYRYVDPWLRSLPPSKSAQFNSTVAAVLAFHEGDRNQLLKILAHDEEPFVYNIVAWLTQLAPAVDIETEATRLGASKERTDEIRKAVEGIKKVPDQIEQAVSPNHYYCEPGVDPCHDESSCVELLYAGGGTAPSCPRRAIFAANHCSRDVVCTACIKSKSGDLECTDMYARKNGSGQQSGNWFGPCDWQGPPAVKCTSVNDPPSCRAP